MEGPSKFLFGLEGIRALYEYGLGWAFSMPVRAICPKGDGHPIIVFPGLGTSDGSTHFIRSFLNDLGYNAVSWGMGRNLGPRNGMDALLEQLVERTEDVYKEHGNEPVSLIGWSLGGIYVREIAKACPNNVRQVITLGTPFKSAANGTNVGKLYEFLSGDKSHKDPEIIKRLSERPPVPYTSMFSKSDGVVNWECSVEEETEISENIEIPGASHLGIGHNPISMYMIADRLVHTKHDWIPYKNK